jgi:hypothetical protein
MFEIPRVCWQQNVFTLTTVSFAFESPIVDCDVVFNPGSNSYQANVTWARIVQGGCETARYYIFSKTTLETPGGYEFDYFAPIQIVEGTPGFGGTLTYDVAPPGTFIDHQCRVLAMFNCSTNTEHEFIFQEDPCVI